MTLVGDGEFAIAQSVPQLDGAIARARDDLAVVGGEGDGENIVGVADEAAGRHTSSELPQAERFVPGGRECVGTVGRDDLGKQSVSTRISEVHVRGGERAYAVRDDVGVPV